MKIRVLDTVQISSLQAAPLKSGDVFDIADAAGAELLAKLPRNLLLVSRAGVPAAATDAPAPPAKPKRQGKGSVA